MSNVFHCRFGLMLFWGSFLAFGFSSLGEEHPGTRPLKMEGDLAAHMVAGIDKYLMRELPASIEKRKQFWKVDNSSSEKYAQSIAPNRERLRKLLGVVDRRLPPHLEYVGGPGAPALLAETPTFSIHAVRWSVLPGVDAEGLLLEPKSGKPLMSAVAISDADHTPEQIAGLADGLPEMAQFARRLAENSVRVLVPTLIDRKDEHSANPQLKRATNQPHREFIHRMAYEMGRTMLGYEIQKVLAGVDWLEKASGTSAARHRIGLMGHGEGGRIAFYAGALDDRVIYTHLNGGSFGPQEDLWRQPIYRNVWGLLSEFGDAEVAAFLFSSLLRPPGGEVGKSLSVNVNDAPVVAGPPNPRPGRGGAAPGAIPPPDTDWAKKEINRTAIISNAHATSGGVSLDALSTNGKLIANVPINMHQFLNVSAVDEAIDWKPHPLTLRGKPLDAADRQKRQFDQLVAYTQRLWRLSEPVRKQFWAKADASSPEKWEQSCAWHRDYFWNEIIGKLPKQTEPMNPRSRLSYDTPKWKGYDVVLDMYPDVFAYGVLLVPKDLKPGEKRPVVVCQHGLEGRPQDVVEPKKRTPYYNSFGAQLADLGYIVYAPQNPYIGRDNFRILIKKGHPLKLSLYSFIVRQHETATDWLATLPFVDSEKIAFYGLSYGGKTAMRIPPLVKRYCLSICAGDFNEWIGKNVSVDFHGSYMWTIEYDMYEFDLGHTFNYAEMANLIAPRPFMVERGHDDGVGIDEMIAYEYAKVRYLFANRLKIPQNAAIEFTPGGHEVFLRDTLRFLKLHTGWPK